jgi:hypothetical protein
MGFDPCNCAMKIRESIWDSNSQHGNSLGSVRVHTLTLFTFSGACDVTLGFLSWLSTLEPLALVVSPRLRLRQKLWSKMPIILDSYNIFDTPLGLPNDIKVNIY